MTGLVPSAPQVRTRGASSATSVFEEPFPELYCSYDVSSAFVISDVENRIEHAPGIGRPVLILGDRYLK
jgi:hypothetical protein